MEMSALKIHRVKEVVKMRIVCGECLSDLRCIKTGDRVIVDDHIYAGNRYECKQCDGGTVVALANTPIKAVWEDAA